MPVGQAERHGASSCPRGIACKPPRIDFGLIGAGEQRDADQHAHQPVEAEARRQEQRQHVGREEQHGDQRHAAPEFDEDDENDPDRRDLSSAGPAPAAMPSGIEATMPVTDTTSVTSRPPHSRVSTDGQSATVEPHHREHDGDADEGRRLTISGASRCAGRPRRRTAGETTAARWRASRPMTGWPAD